MKKIGLLIFLFVSLVSQSQTKNETSTGKSIVVQNIDTMQCNETKNIENRLTSFYKANRNSQFMIIAGSVISIAGAFLYQPGQNQINPFPIVGGVCGLVGGVIYFDSFKYLNMNKKPRIKKTVPDFY